MNLTITDDAITGQNTTHTARRALGHPHAWHVSWLPGRLLDRDSAITAMVLADIAGSGTRQPGDRLWPHIEGWAAELGLTAPGALALVSQAAEQASGGKHGGPQADPQAGPEAAG